MATEMAPPGGDLSYQANADLTAKQYYIVELLSTEKVDVCNSAGDVGFGVLQNDPASGQAAQVRSHFGSKSKVVSDGSGHRHRRGRLGRHQLDRQGDQEDHRQGLGARRGRRPLKRRWHDHHRPAPARFPGCIGGVREG
jgi:hypothetical protein